MHEPTQRFLGVGIVPYPASLLPHTYTAAWKWLCSVALCCTCGISSPCELCRT